MPSCWTRGTGRVAARPHRLIWEPNMFKCLDQHLILASNYNKTTYPKMNDQNAGDGAVHFAVKSKPDYHSCEDVVARLGPANPENATCSTCLEDIEDNEQAYQHSTCGGCWHAECLRAWLNNNCSCPHCRACTRKDIHPFEAPSDTLQLGLAYRSPEWRAYWKARHKQVKKLTSLGISF